MILTINMIAAVCANNGIGYKGDLPWKLKKELQYFNRITRDVKDPQKQNAVIMGRKTWESLPKNWQPLPKRLNFVLSTKPMNLSGAIHCTSFDDLIRKLNSSEFLEKIETAWLIGGSKVYEGALERNLCNRVYLTKIQKEFECDTFLNINLLKNFKEIRDEKVLQEVQEENNVKYTFHVYENTHF